MDALKKMNYDPNTVLDSLYAAGIVTEDESPNENVTFDVDGKTVTRAELREMAEGKADDETVVIDGETLKWGEIREAFSLDDAVRALNEIAEIEDGEASTLTEEQARNMLNLLGQLNAGNLTVRGNRLIYGTSSFPADKKDDGTLDRQYDSSTQSYYYGSYYGEDGYDANRKFVIANNDNSVWYNKTSTGGSGILSDVSLDVASTYNGTAKLAVNNTVTFTVTPSKAQTVPMSLMKYRIVYGNWKGAEISSGDGTLTWSANDNGAKTFSVKVTNDSVELNGTGVVYVQIYDVVNARLTDGAKCWEQRIMVGKATGFAPLSNTSNLRVNFGKLYKHYFNSADPTGESDSATCNSSISFPSNITVPDGDYLVQVQAELYWDSTDPDHKNGGKDKVNYKIKFNNTEWNLTLGEGGYGVDNSGKYTRTSSILTISAQQLKSLKFDWWLTQYHTFKRLFLDDFPSEH